MVPLNCAKDFLNELKYGSLLDRYTVLYTTRYDKMDEETKVVFKGGLFSIVRTTKCFVDDITMDVDEHSVKLMKECLLTFLNTVPPDDTVIKDYIAILITLWERADRFIYGINLKSTYSGSLKTTSNAPQITKAPKGERNVNATYLHFPTRFFIHHNIIIKPSENPNNEIQRFSRIKNVS